MRIKGKHKKIYLERKRKNNKNDMTSSHFLSQNIWIINKQKKRQLLTLNSTQQAIEDKISELISQGIPPRIVILKARQEGVTTYFQAKMIEDSTQNQDRNSLIVSHEQESTSAIFSKTKFMYDNLPDSIKPLQRASNSRELIFDKPREYKGTEKGLNSKIVVKIAGKESIGRSDTYSFVHLSEFAFWKGSEDNSPENQLTAIMQAVPDSLNTIVIIESTAKGFNDFKKVWDEAVTGVNGWTPLFFAWHDLDEYQKEFTSEDDREKFLNSLDDYEKEMQKQFNLSAEQLHWHRHTKQIKCNNNADKMKQENPSFPEEAFIFSGTPVFDNNKIMNQINYLKNAYEKENYITGKFIYNESNNLVIDSSIKFTEAKENKVMTIRIYEKVRQGYPYAIGADTKGEGKDKYTATVINCMTQETVCTLKADISNSKMFTMQLYCLGKYYNYALIGIEINFNTAPIERLVDLRYFKQYQREVKDDFTGKLQKKYGWKTDGITRPLMIDYMIEFSEGHTSHLNDIDTLQEMLTFIYDKNGRPDAMSGKHDDLLFSLMIALQIQRQQNRRIDNSCESIVKFEEEEYSDMDNEEFWRDIADD